MMFFLQFSQTIKVLLIVSVSILSLAAGNEIESEGRLILCDDVLSQDRVRADSLANAP